MSYSHLIEVLEKKLTLKIILLLGQKEKAGFNALQIDLAVNTTTLNTRLLELEQHDLILKARCEVDSRCQYYSLTTQGKELYRKLQFLNS